jgi:hypothetical protein
VRLLYRKSLRHLAALDNLVAWAKNKSATARRGRETEMLEIFLGHRCGGQYAVQVANIAREAATHSENKLKRGAPGATGGILARASGMGKEK